MLFTGPSYKCLASLPRSVSGSSIPRGTTRTPGSSRLFEGESSRGRPRRSVSRDPTAVPSRLSLNDVEIVSLNSPESPCPADQGGDHDVPPLEIDVEADNLREHCLAAHSTGPVTDLYHHYLHETTVFRPVREFLSCTGRSFNHPILETRESIYGILFRALRSPVTNSPMSTT
jgi:hypothetical protein